MYCLKNVYGLRIALYQAQPHSTKNHSADAHRSYSPAMDHRALPHSEKISKAIEMRF